ncbi:MAG: nucleotide pyrophosphohydrolase [Verrucomicrobia bacterium]|nr:nucleotide pyrophosphohydrolase [Verrucomicrobiota bacterium]
MQLSDFAARAQTIRQLYDEQARRDGRRPWTAAEFAQGFAGDVGDLMKLVMAKQGLRPAPTGKPDLDAALAHELADCLWSVLVLADLHGINLEQAFAATMNRLERKLHQA